MTPVLIHVAESTIFAGVIAAVSAWMARSRLPAHCRHFIWLLAFAKFVVPSALLWSAGVWLGSLAPFRPALQGGLLDLSRLLDQSRPQTILVSAPANYSWAPIVLMFVWVLGSVLALTRWTWRLRGFEVQLKPPPATIAAALVRAKRQLSIRANVDVAISPEIAEPLLKSIRRPQIILPESLAGSFSPGELNAVLLHELAHFARRDNLTSALAHLITIAFWFDPLLWWMERRLSIESERACDEVVVAAAQARDEYVSGIAKAARFAVFGAVAGVSGIAGFELKERLELIMSQSESRIANRTLRSVISAVIAALIVIPVAGGFVTSTLRAQTIEKRHAGIEFVSATASGNTQQTQQILSALKVLLDPNETVFPNTGIARWDKWLNEDAAFLITPEERLAFLGLKTDGERDQFVAQFWEKRNPNPGAAVNTFKEEHYRRLAYATKRFGVADAPGWQTDRGRTYILMGPPDEIDSHPDQNREMWRYQLRGTGDNITIAFDISDKHSDS